MGSRNLFRPHIEAHAALALDASGAQANATKLFGDPGIFDSWQRSASFDMAGVLAPFAVEVVAEKAVFDLESDALSVGLAWDDASLLEARPVDLQSGGAGETPGSFVFRINAVRGRTLEVWTSGFDKFGSARIISSADASTIEKEKADEAKKPAIVDPSKPAEGLTKIGLVVAAVIAAVVLGPILFRRVVGA
jgi:hypothetical protein